jgi:hypothetical protein
MSTNPETNRMEDALKNALRREEVPDGFAERVMARVAQQEAAPSGVRQASWSGFFSRPLLRWAAFATVTASVVAGTFHYRAVQREREQGEVAKQQLMLALRIAGSKLQLAKARVNEINQPQTDGQPSIKRSRSHS